MPVTVSEVAELCEGTVDGDASHVLRAANTLELAGPDELAFASNARALEGLPTSQAGCVLVPLEYSACRRPALIRVANPRMAFAKALHTLYPAVRFAPHIHATAIIDPSAKVADDCYIGPHVAIGERSVIAGASVIRDGTFIGRDVSIGSQVLIHPNATIYDSVRIGERTIIHAGCVIGADGFGFIFTGAHYEKFPQVGTVEIGDDVELGANCCIDRAALGVTRIGSGTKLDNLVHVGHNCTVGRNIVIAAQTGFSGSVSVGDYAAIGGQVGVGEKAQIDARAVVGGKAGILVSQHVRAGEPVWGIPARPVRQHLKGLANVNKIAELRSELNQLKRRLGELEAADRRSD